MAGLNVVTYAAAKAYTDQTVVGGGALKGKNCTVDSITDITGGHRVTFKWTLDNGTVQTGTMDVMDGVDGQDGQDGAPGQDGQDGLTPVITVDEITGGHRITITVGTDVETVDVMDGAKGEDGQQGEQGPAGPGVPQGGTQGQVLKKVSGDDYDTEWADEEGGTGHGIPSGGTQGQVLRKTSNDDYDADWSDDEGGQIIQVESLPTASSTEEGNIYQYIGTTGGGLTNGYFYECVFDDPDYIWQAKPVQDPGQALNGIPAGGTANQILQKHSNTDYDAEWVDPASYSQQQADWSQSDNTQVDFIKNKPQNLVQDANYVHTDNNYTDAEVSKLAAIEAGAQVNVKPDWNATAGANDEILNKPTLGTAAAKNIPVSGDAATTEVVMGDDSRLTDARTPVAHTHTVSDISDFPTLGTAAAKDSTNAVTQNDTKLVESGAVYAALSGKVDAVAGKGLSTNDYTDSDAAAVAGLGTASTKGSTDTVTQNSHNLVESGGVYTAIANAISAVYKPAGSKACSQLLSSLLVASNLGKVYNITDSGTTTADFVEGAGKPINPGDNVVIVDVGSSTYKFDLLSGFVDLTNYISKALTPSGLLRDDGTVDTTSYLTSSDISNKADKKVPAATGNLAALDANGNLADSGKKTSAFIEKTLSASGYLKDDGSVDTSLAGTVSSNTTAISNIKDGTTIDSFADVESALSGKENTISDLSDIRSGAAAGATAYQLPSGGITTSDLASGVTTSLGKADTAYQKPSGGIPKTDLVSAVQTSLEKADGAGYWVSGQDKTINSTLTTSIQFTVPDAGYGYDPYFESADGTPVYVEGESKSGTTLTYTIRALTAAQLPCKTKLLAIPVASA